MLILIKFELKLPSYENLLNIPIYYFLYCELLLGKEMFVAKIAQILQQFWNKCHNNSANSFTLHTTDFTTVRRSRVNKLLSKLEEENFIELVA